MYNDPTNPHPYPYQQNPYQQQPPFQPPPPPRRRRSPLQWYTSRSKGGKIGYGCLGLLIVLTMCGLCSAVVTASQSGQTANAPTPTATSAAVQPAQVNASSPTTVAIQPTATPKPTPTPKPAPTHKPASTPAPKPKCQAVNNNPWCYNFSPGNLIYNPPSNFCDYFNCIASFWNGTGFVNECADQTYSKSGGHSGDCSHHGGELRPLYSH